MTVSAERATRPRRDARPPKPSRRWALFLDVDGTLLDIAAMPDAVEVPADLIPLLSRLVRAMDGAVALISGRPIDRIDRLFAPLRLAVAGQHGAELRFAGTGIVRSATPSPILAATRRAARVLAHDLPGVVVEDKGVTLAVHFRAVPNHGARVLAALGDAVAQGDDLEILAGHSVVDVRPKGFHKGAAILALMEAPPFAGRVPVAVGDDVTDDDAYRAAVDLGGHAVRVGPRRSAVAGHWLADPGSVRRWLDEVARTLEDGGTCKT